MESALPQWLEVRTPADTTLASPALSRVLDGHTLGCAASNAWISALSLRPADRNEITVSETDSACNSGFIEYGNCFTEFEPEDTHLWMPETERQVAVVLDELAHVNPIHVGRGWLAAALTAPFADRAAVAIVANPVGGRRSTGVIAFRRELTVCDQVASLDVVVRAFHSEGSFVQRAALLGAFRAQVKADIETAFAALSRADVDLPFEVCVTTEYSDNGMLRHFAALADDARGDAFDGDYDIPAWLDLAKARAERPATMAIAPSRSP
jgi:hypothetical protein